MYFYQNDLKELETISIITGIDAKTFLGEMKRLYYRTSPILKYCSIQKSCRLKSSVAVYGTSSCYLKDNKEVRKNFFYHLAGEVRSL